MYCQPRVALEKTDIHTVLAGTSKYGSQRMEVVMSDRQFSQSEIDAMSKSARSYWRKRGADIPKRRPGPRRGYKQSPEHVAARIRLGADHHAWIGDKAKPKSGRSRALRRFPASPCCVCGASKSDRHHIDGNALNNEPSNISFLCRKCHMNHDGRMHEFIELAIRNQPKAVAARWG